MTLKELQTASKKYLRAREVAVYYGIAENSVWRWARLGVIPKPIKLAPNATRWRISDLEAHDRQIAGEGTK